MNQYDRYLGSIPVGFSINLLEFKALVNDGVSAFGSEITRERNPNLIVQHPQHQKWEYEEVPKVPLPSFFHYETVRAVCNPRCQNQPLQIPFYMYRYICAAPTQNSIKIKMSAMYMFIPFFVIERKNVYIRLLSLKNNVRNLKTPERLPGPISKNARC